MQRLYVALTTVDGHHCVDTRDYDWESWDPAGLSYVADNEDIEMRIQQGEDVTTEFKVALTEYRDEFLESVCAFSNSLGGLIVIGVDRNGHVKGIPDDRIEPSKETVDNVVRQWIEPIPAYKTDARLLGEKHVLVVSIARGDRPPYVFRDHGCFIRAGASDRIASRDELDMFYRNQTPQTPR